MENLDHQTASKSSRLWKKFKDEFRTENCSLNFEKNSEFMKKDPEEVLEYFHSSIWPCFSGSLVYVIYRVFIAIYYTVWFIESIVRNYEFRAQNFYISTKKNINLLLLHPWPVYMTSWSLTILFIHLWLSAFIVLYFYSIDQKTILAKFFHFVFGPFSCSRKGDNLNYIVVKMNQVENGAFNDSIKISLPDQEKNQKPIFNIVQETNQVVGPSAFNNKKTYCDNQHNCQLPSCSVTSNSEAWQLWIKAHVPTVILILIKVSWLLYNIIVISAIVVTVGYFTYVVLMDIQTEPTWIAEIGNLHRHGVNSLVAIVDIVVLAYPVRILHFVYTSIYGWCYALITFLYWTQNPEKNIVYEQIDYKKPMQILGIYVILTTLTFVMQIFHFFAYQFKLYLKEKYLFVKKNCFSANSGL
ncbi:unnamed protein product [Brachionus calyciflorus]|uniref:Rolling stone n=2 Tax=Brachionus calyciflorus TaxID=104777 RepID=A0A814KTH2_9BILA|nr:unnamed protein product [Brachionus calyciflorus]